MQHPSTQRERMNEPLELSITHDTAYTYASSVELAHHIGYLRPLDDIAQSVEAFELSVYPIPSFHINDRDAFGNARVFFSLYAPHLTLQVRSQSRVRIVERYADLDFDGGPDWQSVRDALHYNAQTPWLPETELVFASPYVPLLKELREYARPSFPAGRPLRAAAQELMHRIHSDFVYESGSTDVSTPLIDVFRERHGVCQDFAHVLVGCLRSLGLAARYVSGYLLTQPPPGQARLLGADASHAWASVFCTETPDNGGWIDLDPTNDIVPATGHITVAWGRDFGDVAPLYGVIRGGGEHELAVAVSVIPLEPTSGLESGEPEAYGDAAVNQG
jgi:transglutaminase-like putative cysteine protease